MNDDQNEWNKDWTSISIMLHLKRNELSSYETFKRTGWKFKSEETQSEEIVKLRRLKRETKLMVELEFIVLKRNPEGIL